MKTAGIIAEYNPFHNGHAYHIQETRRLTGADYVIIVMSGNFVQRGEPAILDKYARTRMALNNGADLVLELPAAYACASAEIFASGAVRTLQGLGVVDVLSFGCETDDDVLADWLARLYLDEPSEFSSRIQDLLRQGLTYPQARAAATEALLSHPDGPSFFAHQTSPAIPADKLHLFLASPNNILSVEYRKALLKYDAGMKPLSVLRRGDYHSTKIPENETEYASASAIRSQLLKKYSSASSLLSRQVPADVFRLLTARRDFMQAEDFSMALGYALLTARNGDLTRYADITPDLADRIRNHLTEYQGWNSFVDQIKTRQMTRTRISRALLHLMLQIETDQMTRFSQGGLAFYARVLGFRRESSPLLSAIKKNRTLPILTKMADAKRTLQDYYRDIGNCQAENALALLQTDLFAADLYESTAASCHNRARNNEYRHGVIIV